MLWRILDRLKTPVKEAALSVLMVGLVVGLVSSLGSAGFIQVGITDAVSSSSMQSTLWVSDTTNLANDSRIRAFLKAYGAFVDSLAYAEGDVVFSMAGHPIYFQEGRMLAEDQLGEAASFDPIFYRYPPGPLFNPPPLADPPTYSADHLVALFGRTEAQIRRNCRSASFLGHKVFVNKLILDSLLEVEREIRAAAAVEPEVAEWMGELEIIYSFSFRPIADSRARSLHGFGLAMDLVPASYGGRHVYWRWSRALDREDWDRIPLSHRWSPPPPVIEAFERHGFIWGGKWARFDTIHFEYRPEILYFNR